MSTQPSPSDSIISISFINIADRRHSSFTFQPPSSVSAGNPTTRADHDPTVATGTRESCRRLPQQPTAATSRIHAHDVHNLITHHHVYHPFIQLSTLFLFSGISHGCWETLRPPNPDSPPRLHAHQGWNLIYESCPSKTSSTESRQCPLHLCMAALIATAQQQQPADNANIRKRPSSVMRASARTEIHPHLKRHRNRLLQLSAPSATLLQPSLTRPSSTSCTIIGPVRWSRHPARSPQDWQSAEGTAFRDR